MADLNEWALEIDKQRHPCKYCHERHRACQDQLPRKRRAVSETGYGFGKNRRD